MTAKPTKSDEVMDALDRIQDPEARRTLIRDGLEHLAPPDQTPDVMIEVLDSLRANPENECVRLIALAVIAANTMMMVFADEGTAQDRLEKLNRYLRNGATPLGYVSFRDDEATLQIPLQCYEHDRLVRYCLSLAQHQIFAVAEHEGLAEPGQSLYRLRAVRTQ